MKGIRTLFCAATAALIGANIPTQDHPARQEILGTDICQSIAAEAVGSENEVARERADVGTTIARICEPLLCHPATPFNAKIATIPEGQAGAIVGAATWLLLSAALGRTPKRRRNLKGF